MQYASVKYVDQLEGREFEISMTRTGNSCVNVRMESFFKTLKYDEV